jgi:cytochrome c
MKKIIPRILLCLACWGCGSNDKDGAKEKAATADVTNDPVFVAGRDLVANSGCNSCHRVDETMTGPAYRKVAEKYEYTPENVAMLTQKVIHGGSGNWGTIPMLPHPNLAKGDVETMIKYVLMLRK